MGVGQQMGQQNSSSNSQHDVHGEDWDSLRDDVSDMAGAAVERGRHFIDAARDQASDYAERRKDDIAQSVADFATSLRESTSSFEERPNIRAVVDSAAEGLETLAGTIRERSFADIFNDFEDMARRRPATVAAVSAAIGFVAARFIKSTAEDLRQDQVIPRTSRTGRDRSRQGPGPQARGNA
ncbi:hypothetical protein [Microvirga subterranea]|uniref:ElaB/YqjD/DUF883 family membrane-anchored ribosome-binding protein n=1 Tax=Microvirga subterranea TaxID=186651 RepID=A0A370HLG2_9HYPH|nr:hypothetical protein [Microvirga subterranea]RDI59358.1 hypothetical protein DES45_104270 [Microvirga subterranea]